MIHDIIFNTYYSNLLHQLGEMQYVVVSSHLMFSHVHCPLSSKNYTNLLPYYQQCNSLFMLSLVHFESPTPSMVFYRGETTKNVKFLL